MLKVLVPVDGSSNSRHSDRRWHRTGMAGGRCLGMTQHFAYPLELNI